MKLPVIDTKRLAVKLKPAAEIMVKKGHPWVFEDSIVKCSPNGQTGDIVVIFDKEKNQFLALGLYDADSPIRIKILEAHKKGQINEAWFKNAARIAFSKRQPLLDSKTNGYRLIHGENDLFPGFIADVYGDTMVVKLYSEIWFPYLKWIFPILLELTKCKNIVIRLNRKLTLKGNEYGLTDGIVVHGVLESEEVPFLENGLSFKANVISGHKTGFFLDHRQNRIRIGELAKDKKVLDVFCYAGGFSVHAMSGGAKRVVSLDISKQALEVAKQNMKLNGLSLSKHLCIDDDAFKGLSKLVYQKKTFDIVVIDPPSFAKSKTDIPKAKESYKKLFQLGIKLTGKDGILMLASCSSRVTATAFYSWVEEVLISEDVHYSFLEKTYHDIDHPISFPEGAYLKSVYYKIH